MQVVRPLLVCPAIQGSNDLELVAVFAPKCLSIAGGGLSCDAFTHLWLRHSHTVELLRSSYYSFIVAAISTISLLLTSVGSVGGVDLGAYTVAGSEYPLRCCCSCRCGVLDSASAYRDLKSMFASTLGKGLWILELRFGAAMTNCVPRFYHRIFWIASHYGCKFKDLFTSKILAHPLKLSTFPDGYEVGGREGGREGGTVTPARSAVNHFPGRRTVRCSDGRAGLPRREGRIEWFGRLSGNWRLARDQGTSSVGSLTTTRFSMLYRSCRAAIILAQDILFSPSNRPKMMVCTGEEVCVPVGRGKRGEVEVTQRNKLLWWYKLDHVGLGEGGGLVEVVGIRDTYRMSVLHLLCPVIRHTVRERVEHSSADEVMEFAYSEYRDLAVAMGASGGKAQCMLHASNVRESVLLLADQTSKNSCDVSTFDMLMLYAVLNSGVTIRGSDGAWQGRSPPPPLPGYPGSTPFGFTTGSSRVGAVLDDDACWRVFSRCSRFMTIRLIFVSKRQGQKTRMMRACGWDGLAGPARTRGVCVSGIDAAPHRTHLLPPSSIRLAGPRVRPYPTRSSFPLDIEVRDQLGQRQHPPPPYPRSPQLYSQPSFRFKASETEQATRRSRHLQGSRQGPAVSDRPSPRLELISGKPWETETRLAGPGFDRRPNRMRVQSLTIAPPSPVARLEILLCCIIWQQKRYNRIRHWRLVRLLAFHQGEPGSIPSGNHKWESCRTTLLAGGFSRGSPYPRHCIRALPHSHLVSPTSVLDTSLLRAAHISQLNLIPTLGTIPGLRDSYTRGEVDSFHQLDMHLTFSLVLPVFAESFVRIMTNRITTCVVLHEENRTCSIFSFCARCALHTILGKVSISRKFGTHLASCETCLRSGQSAEGAACNENMKWHVQGGVPGNRGN
ncbi:hypothetical protein PR048_030112 [Dryococelus australis]|uniref:Uncharacterized protein n=1 Tax=Dryococelus australis TaxID=614101 RepID=A0ABQ9GBW9_9NEOP|nr:hypothetical protein PR048_030112 [Dryococelus australis]